MEESNDGALTYPQQTSPFSSSSSSRFCSCVVILLTFFFFASVILIFGLYGSVELVLSPNCSRLLQANSFFVEDLEVKAGAEYKSGTIMLHGFLNPPPLDVQTKWQEMHNVFIPANFHEEWVYYLNEGAHISVSYNVKSQASHPLTLTIAQSEANLIEWIEDPSHPNATLTWNLICGNGSVQMNVVESSDYYVAVGNINHQEIEVQLEFKIQNLMYNTSGAYYQCSLDHRLCILKLLFLGSNFAILTTSGTPQAGKNHEWNVEVSYGPRWITYFVGSGVITVVILLAFELATYCSADGANQRTAEVTMDRGPLLQNKDDENVSLGSSYDSVSHDDEDIENCLGVMTKLLKEGEPNNPHHICAICCGTPRDCFFLPCGHCATCFACGTRTVNEAGTCPMCQRKMKKVRKIFTV